MGWDAYATTKQGERLNTENCSKGIRIKNKRIRSAFKIADEKCVKEHGSVDGFLSSGGLDVSICAKMLEKATGQSAWSEDGWDYLQVKIIAILANWNFKYEKQNAWAYASAKIFLETCAELGLGITFSY